MFTCKEFILDDVMAITAIPLADLAIGTAAWQLTPTIPASSFSPALANSITVGLRPAAPDAALIPIMRTTGKAQDEEGDSVAGRLHTVTVSCEADDRDPAVWDVLHRLERTPSHLLLTFRDQSRAFVRGSEDTYLCTVGRDGSKTTVTFRIPCLMGIQMLVSPPLP